MTQKQFKALQQKWYKKLEKSGFEDIEQTSDDRGFLKQNHNSYFKTRHTPLSFQNTQEYFLQCSHFLLEHDFNTEQARAIWKLHSEGYSRREIAKMLKIKWWVTVHRVIVDIEKVMLDRS